MQSHTNLRKAGDGEKINIIKVLLQVFGLALKEFHFPLPSKTSCLMMLPSHSETLHWHLLSSFLAIIQVSIAKDVK